MTTNTTPQEHHASHKPTFTPNYWEKKHGKVIDGVFHCPSFSVHYKGQPIRIHGVEHSYRYAEAYHIAMHLEAVLGEEVQIVVTSWQNMAKFNVVMDASLDEEEYKALTS